MNTAQMNIRSDETVTNPAVCPQPPDSTPHHQEQTPQCTVRPQASRLVRRSTSGGFSLVELLVVVAIIAILAAISVPLYMNQKKKAGDATIRSDVHNVAVHLATTYTSPVTAVTGSDGATTPDLTVTTSNGTEIIPKMGASVYGNTTAWCVSGIATSGKIFAATSTNRAVYEATTFCTTPTTQPTPGSGGGGTVVSVAGNLLTTAQAATTGGWLASGCTIAYTGNTGTLTTVGTPASNAAYEHVTTVSVGETYTATATLSGISGVGRQVLIAWRTSTTGSEVGRTYGNVIAAGSNGVSVATGPAPVGAVVAQITIYSISPPTGSTASFTQLGFWSGSGGQWALPGQPIYQ